MIECCGNCKHYTEAYCNLMDDFVEPCDNCGMYDGDTDIGFVTVMLEQHRERLQRRGRTQ